MSAQDRPLVSLGTIGTIIAFIVLVVSIILCVIGRMTVLEACMFGGLALARLLG